MQLIAPVQRDRAAYVALLIGIRVLIDLNQLDAGIAEMLFDPGCRDQCRRVGVVGHHSSFTRWVNTSEPDVHIELFTLCDRDLVFGSLIARRETDDPPVTRTDKETEPALFV